jgi:hypothetical protein
LLAAIENEITEEGTLGNVVEYKLLAKKVENWVVALYSL